MSHVAHKKFLVCPNCHYSFKDADNFCPNCGQENHDFRLPAKHLFLELLENTLHFDSKFFKTMGLLLAKPGRLTEEFVQNRRVAYVPPFRLYVFISFFFFLIVSFFTGHPGTPEQPGKPLSSIQDLKPGEKGARSIFFGLITFDFERDADPGERGSPGTPQTQASPGVLGETHRKYDKFMERQEEEFLTKTDEEIDQKILKTLSFLMFLLMPFFALILKGFYLRQKRLYVEHLIFSIHFHCFAFIILALSALLSNVISASFLNLTSFLLILLYLFLALRHFFRQGVWKSLGKAVFVQAMYVVVLLTFLVFAVFINFLIV
ncbi:DUF3667 domain-containing protein [Rufibacter sp. XAAS-G3-1]|uniref:DUF3667 domain-containing protein n=1 Tax=Rufibacter sp. XAAS-G3-1 TaxID=2729134 RepID=UPI0015E79F05|nr:DUF3667 domain-containing protein [Rufibacter sp. XAAS-G3-1]